MAISKEQMKDMYVKMRRIRDFESTAARLFAEGKIPGFVHLYLPFRCKYRLGMRRCLWPCSTERPQWYCECCPNPGF